MADLEFLVDYSSLQRANEEINKTGTNAQKSARVFEQAFQRVEREQNKALANVRQQITASQRFERQKKREEQAALKAARTQAREIDNLRSKFNPLFAASKLYEKTQNELNRALSVGAINADQYAREIDQLNREFTEFSTTTSAANSAQNRFANQLRTGSIRSTNNLGVAAQQAGFQVGDFLVQVQSGANPMMAFGQQATQLVGVLPLLAGSVSLSAKTLMALSVGLGVGIPLITAAAGAFLRMRSNAKEAADTVETFEDKLKSARQEVKGMAEDLELVRSGFKDAFEKTLVDQVEEASKSLQRAEANLARVQNQTGSGARALAQEGAVESAKEAVRLASLELASAKELQRQKREQERSESVINQLAEVRVILREQERELQAEIARGFANTVGPAKTLRNETEAHIAKMAEVFENAKRLKEEIGEAAFEALRLSGVDMTNGIESAVGAAKNLSKELGVSLETAIKISAQGRGGPDGEVIFDPRDPRFDPVTAALAKANKGPTRLFENKPFKSPSSGSSGGGGGGGTVSDPREFLKTLEKELQLKELLVGVGETQEQQLKLEAQLKESIAKQTEGLTAAQVQLGEEDKKRIQTLVKQAEAIRKAEEAENRRQKAIEDFEKRTEDAITNIVKGADSIEDAFMGMIRAIVEELFRQQVAKPAASALGDFVSGIFNAKGNAFSGGRVLPFANGGVVSNTTAFPLRGGNTGIMGEAGPEAILPLKRGKGGRLGVEGGGNTTVNQTFMFSANGDDSVKRIIAQEAPKIAKLTERSIIESRKRGGQIRSTFGGGN